MSKSRMAHAIAVVAGIATVATVGLIFTAVVQNHAQDLESKTGVQLKVASSDVLTDEQASQIPPGPPSVAVVIQAVAQVTSALGPQVLFTIGNAEVEHCLTAPDESLRLSKVEGPSSSVKLEVQGGWCFNVKPNQTLVARSMPGELLDVRTDSFVAGDTNVEYVEFELPDGTKQSVVAAAVNVCDNDGRCVATGVIEKTTPQKVLSLRLPLTAYSDVVAFGTRAQFGGFTDTSPYMIASFPEVVALVNAPHVTPRGTNEYGQRGEQVGEQDPEASDEDEESMVVYDEDAPEVNTVD